MSTPRRHRVQASLRQCAGAALLVALAMLPGCSDLALPPDETAPSSPAPDDNKLIANHVKATFKDHATYSMFEISGARWVHSFKGWSWLTCIRFQDHGHRRTYAFFVKNGAIVESRYSVQTDACDAQIYLPFDLTPAATTPAAGGVGPLY